jgi:hypothetical protein
MKTDLKWSLLYRTLIFAMGCSSSYLAAHLLNLPKGTGWILIVLSGVVASKISVPIMSQETPPTKFIQKEKTATLAKPERTCKIDENSMEADSKDDPGIRSNQGTEAELCLMGTASTVFRGIFEPLLESKNARLSAIGALASEAVIWLVSHGDVQSVVSKFDISESGNADEKYETLKKISLFDHSFNTCLHAFELGSKGHFTQGHPIRAYLAALAGLLHDVGKHPHFYPRIQGKLQYKSIEHPVYGVDAINYFVRRAKIDPSFVMPIIDAVAKHHQDNSWNKKTSGAPHLPWILQQADYAARRDEMASMKNFKKSLAELNLKNDRDDIIIDETGSKETVKTKKPGRPLNLSKIVAVPPSLRDRKILVKFLTEIIGDYINRYSTSISNLDMRSEHPIYACFTHGTDLMVRMSFIEEAWEKFAMESGADLREKGGKFPMQAAIKGLLQYLDHIEPGLVQRPLLPKGFAFIMIQVQQGWDRWTKTANYIPLSLPLFLSITGMDGSELERRKIEEDDLAGRDFLERICGWKKC